MPVKFPGNLGDLFQQMQQVQQNFGEIQKELEQKTVEASAGGGMVTVIVNGAFNVVEVKIEKTVVNPDDVEMLQDLVRAASNEALRKAKDMMKEEMKKLTGGLPLPIFS